jgi:hypothetical protein
VVHKLKINNIEQFIAARRPLIMSRNKAILSATIILALAALYLYEYKDAILGRPIQISHTMRLRLAMAARRRPSSLSPDAPLIPTFTLGNDYRLTALKLFRLDEFKARGYARPLWELVADSKSYPTRVFLYGRGIPGMHPKVADEEPEPLVTNVTYRLVVTAGRLKGEHDFTITDKDLPTPPPQ